MNMSSERNDRARRVWRIVRVSLALSFYSPYLPFAEQVEACEDACESSLRTLRMLESKISDALEQVGMLRREAEKSAEWHGQEEFGLYVNVLRDQEMSLRAEIESIRRTTCPAGRDTTANTNP